APSAPDATPDAAKPADAAQPAPAPEAKPAEQGAAATPAEAKPEAKKADDKKPDEKKPGKSPEEVKKEVDDLNAKVGKWAYALPAYKATSLASKMSDMLKDLPAANPSTPANPGTPSGDMPTPVAPWEKDQPAPKTGG